MRLRPSAFACGWNQRTIRNSVSQAVENRFSNQRNCAIFLTVICKNISKYVGFPELMNRLAINAKIVSRLAATLKSRIEGLADRQL